MQEHVKNCNIKCNYNHDDFIANDWTEYITNYDKEFNAKV